jgi:hypothetical protein
MQSTMGLSGDGGDCNESATWAWVCVQALTVQCRAANSRRQQLEVSCITLYSFSLDDGHFLLQKPRVAASIAWLSTPRQKLTISLVILAGDCMNQTK